MCVVYWQKKDLASCTGSRDPLLVYLQLYDKRNCELVTNEISVFSAVLQIDKSCASRIVNGCWGYCLSGDYLYIKSAQCSRIALLCSWLPLIWVWSGWGCCCHEGGLTPLAPQWQHNSRQQPGRDCPDPHEDVTRSVRLIYSHDPPLLTWSMFQI